MGLAKTREKLVRRLFSPVELVYDLTTHWFLFLLIASLGILVLVAKVTSDPPLYECNATLVLRQNSMSVDGDRRGAPSRDTDSSFMAEQLSLLRSDAVLKLLVEDLKWYNILQQDEDQPNRKLGLFFKAYRAAEKMVEERFSDLFSAAADPNVPENERDLQRAIESFRRRSSAQPDRKSNIVTLSVYGFNRGGLQKELEAWIVGYRSWLDQLGKDTYIIFLKSRLDVLGKEETNAKQLMEKFKQENPEISLEQKKWLEEKLLRLKMIQEDLWREQSLGVIDPSHRMLQGGLAPLTRSVDLLQRMKDHKAVLDVELLGLKTRFPETSDKTQAKEREIEAAQAEIDRLEKDIILPGVADGKPDLKKVFEEKNRRIEEEIIRIQKDLSAMDDKLATLTNLLEDHRRAVDILNRYKVLNDSKSEQLVARQEVDIQVQDPARTSATPVPVKNFQKISLGSLASLGVALFVAFGLEFFARRIRFKRDIEEELGLRVVGTVPEK